MEGKPEGQYRRIAQMSGRFHACVTGRMVAVPFVEVSETGRGSDDKRLIMLSLKCLWDITVKLKWNLEAGEKNVSI